MAPTRNAEEIEVAGHAVRLTSPDKVVFPRGGYTKRDVFAYYLAVGDGIMRALRDRPTTLQRFPDGIEGEMFFQKRIPTRGVPPWVRTAKIKFPSGRSADELCPADLAHVAWAAQMGTIVFHPWPVRGGDVDSPDELRIDLDPQPGTDFDEDRKSTRLNSSHANISYAVFCLKKTNTLNSFATSRRSCGVYFQIHSHASTFPMRQQFSVSTC